MTSCVSEFHIISNFESIDITENEHTHFSYVELSHDKRTISCLLQNGEVMHRGCNIYDDDNDEIETVMEGEVVDSYPDGIDTVYIIQV